MILKYLFPTRLIMGAATLFILWQAVVFVRPEPRNYSAAEKAAVATAARALKSRLEQQLPADRRRVGVAHFVNDPQDVVTDTVRTTFATADSWQLEDGSVIRKFFGDISKTVLNATSLDEVLHAARRVELDLLVAGRTVLVEKTEDGALATLEILAYDIGAGSVLLRESIAGMATQDSVRQDIGRDGPAPWLRFVLWTAFVLLLPWATWFLTRWAVARQSNAASFLLMTVYVVADALVALMFVGFRITGILSGVLLLVAIAVCAAYNYWACERIAPAP